MNQKKFFIYAALLVVAGLACGYALAAGLQDDAVAPHVTPQQVHAPAIPAQVQFAGRDIDLRRHDLRERFDRELLTFTYMHGTTYQIIKRANRYFPLIEPILHEQGVPDDFKYLAVVESYLNPRVVSPVGAVGIWQFVDDTARECGLEVNSEVDERRHLQRATEAACRYLKKSYELYGDWLTAAASYNAGRRRISSSLDQQGADNCFGLHLNEETSRYIFRLMAAKELLTHPKDFGFHLRREDFYHTVRTTEVAVTTPVSDWTAWTKEHGTDYVQLKYFNPWITSMRLSNPQGKTYRVQLPLPEDLSFSLDKVHIHNPTWVE